MKFWQWFLAHGDKLLTALTTIALTPGVAALLPPWAAPVLAALATAHIVVLPEPTPTAPATPSAPSKQGGFARLGLVATLAVFALAGTAVVACKTLPSATAQSGIAAAVDIATGLAVQNGSTDPAVWKARATQFEQAAKALQAINAAGPTSLQTILADLQPHIAKLGPADVLAANALVAALAPILQAQLGSNPTLANTQAEIALILGDVIAACTAYTGA